MDTSLPPFGSTPSPSSILTGPGNNSRSSTADPFEGTVDDLAETQVSVQEVLRAQIRIAKMIQTKLSEGARDLNPRDFKDLVGAASSIIGLTQRSEESLRKLTTYEKFVTLVMRFLRGRSDQLGEDLVAHLKAEAAAIGAYQDVEELIDSEPT